MWMSTYIDLFSGIGGFALALRNISQPRLYCDIERSSQQVLIKLIKNESLPPAPVIYDVKDVRKAVMPHLRFHMIASGFPCIGFSAAGQRKGFMNKHSSLFYELLRITKEFGPKLVFMENTPQIVASGGMHVIAVEFGKLAYDLDWIVLPAYSVGAHHARFRWYCLAWKRGYKHTWNIPFREGFEWPKEPPVKDRMVKTRSKHDSERLGMLGNAIVPDAGRRAFIILVSGFRTGATSELVLTPPATCDMQRSKTWEHCGAFINNRLYKKKCNKYPRPDLKLEFLATKPIIPYKRIRRELVTQAFKQLWATPRQSVRFPSRTLTERTLSDLPTQLAFEKHTPKGNRFVNPRFVEQLMGYPKDWTKFWALSLGCVWLGLAIPANGYLMQGTTL